MTPEITTMLYIFFARLCDVSLGTVRVILIIRGYRNIAPILGFVEVLIWLTAISKALANMSGFDNFLVYAAGYAAGNYIGMWIETKLSIGYQSLQIITSKKVTALPMTLREEGFGVTNITGHGAKGEVIILYTVVHKRDVKRIVDIVKILEPNAFIAIEDIRSHLGGYVTKKSFFEQFGRLISKNK